MINREDTFIRVILSYSEIENQSGIFSNERTLNKVKTARAVDIFLNYLRNDHCASTCRNSCCQKCNKRHNRKLHL